MQIYTVVIEDRIACAGTIRVEADNAAEATLIAKREAMEGNIKMLPMENGEEGPHVYQVKDQNGDEVATLGDDIGHDSNKGCLTEHLDALLEREGIDEYEFDEDLLADEY